MWVGVWVCGCVGVWVCGCVGVWVCGCVVAVDVVDVCVGVGVCVWWGQCGSMETGGAQWHVMVHTHMSAFGRRCLCSLPPLRLLLLLLIERWLGSVGLVVKFVCARPDVYCA